VSPVSLPPHTAAKLLIAATTALRLVWAGTLEITTDEAYHWQFTEHPAVSYFDHPPMTAWVAKLGLLVCGGWVHPFSLRVGFVFLFAGTCWLMFRWAARWFGDKAGLWAVLGFSLSHYITAFGGPFALPDSPLFFFALLTWSAATDAILDPWPSVWRWVLVGVGFGGAMLSKYHGILLPAGVVLYAVLTPGKRNLLWSPGPWLAVLIGGLLFTPVVWWNAENGWASFRFQGGRASSGLRLMDGGPLTCFGWPVLYLLPWMWFWTVLELGRLFRFRSVSGAERLLVCLAVAPLGLTLLASGYCRVVLPHWPLLGFLPLFALAGKRWAAMHDRSPVWTRRMGYSWAVLEAAVVVVILLQAKAGAFAVPKGVTDVTLAYSGWPSVADELTRRGLLDDPAVFVFTDNWDDTSQLAFAFRNRVQTACYNSLDARGFAFWTTREQFLGRTGLLVTVGEHDTTATAREFAPIFTRVTLAADFRMTRGGTPFRPVRVYRCETQVQPYPFDFAPR
jgi:4-amino-4-deoxy-L-arabinose transferase-like glycosyltransferase